MEVIIASIAEYNNTVALKIKQQTRPDFYANGVIGGCIDCYRALRSSIQSL